MPSGHWQFLFDKRKGQGDIFGQPATVIVLHTSQITRGVESSIPWACSAMIEPSTFTDNALHTDDTVVFKKKKKKSQSRRFLQTPPPHLCLDINCLERSKCLLITSINVTLSTWLLRRQWHVLWGLTKLCFIATMCWSVAENKAAALVWWLEIKEPTDSSKKEMGRKEK